MPISTPPSTTLSTPSPTERNSYLEGEQRQEPSSNMPIRRPIYLIVATSVSPPLGIGFRNSLPWGPIRSDMSFFVKATTTITKASPSDGNYRPTNAVIMGRKTWDSIPLQYRPLSGRLNVIITRSETKNLAEKIAEELRAKKRGSLASSSTDDEDTIIVDDHPTESSSVFITSSTPTQTQPQILVSNSLASSLSLLPSVKAIFCIGGAEIYRQLLSLDNTNITLRVLQTQIRKLDGTSFECDTFFPVDLQVSPEWKSVDKEMVKEWIGVDPPQKNEDWVRDEKSRTEIRVQGWERR